MRPGFGRIVWAVLALAAMTLACASVQTGPEVTNIRMTTDETGETPTDAYAPGDDFFVFADLSGIDVGSLIQARWYAADAPDLPPNTELNMSDYSYEAGIAYVFFQLTTSDGGDWPIGAYRVEMYLNGTKVGERTFDVR